MQCILNYIYNASFLLYTQIFFQYQLELRHQINFTDKPTETEGNVHNISNMVHPQPRVPNTDVVKIGHITLQDFLNISSIMGVIPNISMRNKTWFPKVFLYQFNKL